MPKEYLKDFDAIIEADKRKVVESDLSPKNKELILRFIEEYKVIKGLQPPTVHKHLFQLRQIGLILGKDFDIVLKQKTEIIRVIGFLDSKEIRGGRKYCASSVYDYKKSLKAFFRWLWGKGKNYPPCVGWINLTKNPSKDRLPESILSKGDILDMVSATNNVRDAALTFCLWECGQRINVFATRRLKHISFDGKGCRIAFTRDDKTHEVWLRLVECTAAMAAWVNAHPDRENPEAYLWVNITGKEKETKDGVKEIKQLGIKPKEIETPDPDTQAITAMTKYFKQKTIELAVKERIENSSKPTHLYRSLNKNEKEQVKKIVKQIKTQMRQAKKSGD